MSIVLRFALVFFAALQLQAIPWTPQLGTVTHPKLPELSSLIKQGDVVKVGGNYYRALDDFDLDENREILDDLPEDANSLWRRIHYGSYLLPKVFDEKDSVLCNDGDFYQDGDTLFRASWNGASCSWKKVNEQENWMSLLRSEIGDTRLGDLLIPGSHDSGTSGITEDSILVDRNFLFQIAERVEMQFVANWSLTHGDKLGPQLLAGFRRLDLRIADTEENDGLFHWWHGLTGDEISEGLDQIVQFALGHPEEVLILKFQHFARPGNMFDPTLPITMARREVLSSMILSSLGNQMAPPANLSQNPTVNEVLATGRNIIAMMEDSYIRGLDDRYWDVVSHSSWSSVSNPEELFVERSAKLREFKSFYADQMTDLSAATTANEQVIIAGLINTFGNNDTIMDIITDIVPGLAEVTPSNMSYEGLWTDLFFKARFGTNTDGMHARPNHLYTSGASVNYLGCNDQARHWVARPDLYKPNIIYADDFETSTLVDLAIQFNRGDIGREISITLQGSSMTGYYMWEEDGFGTSGGTDGINCTSVAMQYTITDQGQVLLQEVINEFGEYSVAEGTFPALADILLEVSSVGSNWQELYFGNIQSMVDTNSDLFVRGRDFGDATGFAYISSVYDDYGEECDLPPIDTSNVVNLILW